MSNNALSQNTPATSTATHYIPQPPKRFTAERLAEISQRHAEAEAARPSHANIKAYLAYLGKLADTREDGILKVIMLNNCSRAENNNILLRLAGYPGMLVDDHHQACLIRQLTDSERRKRELGGG